MYTNINFKTKKQLKEAVSSGRAVSVYNPEIDGDSEPKNGTVFLEGPHYPLARTWFAKAEIREGIIIKVS